MISGAVLDVFEVEPLPKESELWQMDNVFITPHSAIVSEDYHDKTMKLFSDNLQRFIEGRELRNVVEKNKGF